MTVPVASPSGDAGNGIDMSWTAPPECPDAARVKRATERLLGDALDAPRRQRIVARARVRRNEAQNYELELLLSANERVAEETLVAKRCTALADVTALKIALASDPIAVVSAIKPPVTQPVTSGPEDARGGPMQPGANEGAPRASGDRARFGVRIAGGAGFGPLPSAAAGGSVVASLQFPHLRTEIGAQAFGGTDARYSDLPEVGAHLQLFSGLARACATPAAGPVQFPVCLGVELGFMRGEGFGTAEPQTSNSAWGALVVGPALRVPISGGLALWVEADAVLPLMRPGFHVRNLQTLYVAPSGASRAWAGFEVVVP